MAVPYIVRHAVPDLNTFDLIVFFCLLVRELVAKPALVVLAMEVDELVYLLLVHVQQETRVGAKFGISLVHFSFQALNISENVVFYLA